MNPIVVVLLLIILLVICYIIYKALFPNVTSLKTVTDLSKGSTTIQITDGQATNYNVSYATWVYVNVWDSVPKTIFSRNADVGLRLDSTSPTLYCDVAINKLATAPSNDPSYNAGKNAVGANATAAYASQTITVTENFPMQKWVFIIVSMDGAGFTDVYLDGKLVKSVKLLNTRPSLPKAEDSPIILSDNTNKWNAFISQFYRYLYTMDPQTAWNLYLYGNGIGLSQYNVDVTLSKNGIIQNDIQVF